MQFVQMKCPNCNADLEVENGIDSFFCKYCGTKIMVAGQDAASIHTKAALHVANRILDQRETKMKQAAKEREIEREERKKQGPGGLIALVAAMVILFGIMLFFAHGESAERKEQVAKLEATYAEIQTDIANGNYDSALLKANSLHYTISSSETEKKAWDQKREAVIALIYDKMGKEYVAPTLEPTQSSSGVIDKEAVSEFTGGLQEVADAYNSVMDAMDMFKR